MGRAVFRHLRLIGPGWLRSAAVALIAHSLTAMSATGVQVTEVYGFRPGPDKFDGANPYSGLVQGPEGDFYGTTQNGGINGRGTVFKLTATGALTTLHSFNFFGDGANPYAGLAQGTDGSYYGTTDKGGSGHYLGTAFKITSTGNVSTLGSMDYTNGYDSYSGVILGRDGNFYGTTYSGGGNSLGCVFRMTSAGDFTVLHAFDAGGWPYGGLVQGQDGSFYGTTTTGGSNGYGTIFQISPSGVLATLHSFNKEDGLNPMGTLVEGRDGNFYGTAPRGGTNGSGTAFRITPTGAFTLLYSFPFVSFPQAGLVQGSDGNFYGSSYDGPRNPTEAGYIFKMTPDGAVTTLFRSC